MQNLLTFQNIFANNSYCLWKIHWLNIHFSNGRGFFIDRITGSYYNFFQFIFILAKHKIVNGDLPFFYFDFRLFRSLCPSTAHLQMQPVYRRWCVQYLLKQQHWLAVQMKHCQVEMPDQVLLKYSARKFVL